MSLEYTNRLSTEYTNNNISTSSNFFTVARRYTSTKEIEDVAIRKYKNNGSGITFDYLLSSGLANHKKQAQTTLKYCLRRNILFVLTNHKPQQYYPTCLKSEILSKLSKNIPVRVTEAGSSTTSLLQSVNNSSLTAYESVFIPTLEGHILPLLPSAPLYIHKLNLKLRIKQEYYDEILIPSNRNNRGKEHEDVIGNTRVRFYLYSNGTVMIFTESSNHPFKLENEIDHSRLIAFFGQIRDRLATFLMDKHERIVPDIMDWQLVECDINKDIVVNDSLLFTGLKIQVRHLDHLFRVYIKSLGEKTVCRVEKSLVSKCSAIEAINNIFNPYEKLEKRLCEMDRKLDSMLPVMHSCNNNDIDSDTSVNNRGGVT